MDPRSHVKRLICFQVLVLDRLHLNKPDASPAELCLGEHLSARQWSVVEMLEHLAFDGNTPELVDAAAMGRGLESLKVTKRTFPPSPPLW